MILTTPSCGVRLQIHCGAIVPAILALGMLSFPFWKAPNGSAGSELQRAAAAAGSGPHLPLSRENARTWIALRKTRIGPMPKGSSLQVLVRHIEAKLDQSAIVGRRTEVYLDPSSLKERAITLDTPARGVPLDELPALDVLRRVALSFGMALHVYDGVVVMDDLCDGCPAEEERTAAEAWTWFLLHERAPMAFNTETPLRDVLQTFRAWLKDASPPGKPIDLVLDNPGLSLVNQSPDSKVSCPLHGASMCTSLALMLKQVGLRFWVRGDGALIITSPAASRDGEFIMTADDLRRSYRFMRQFLSDRGN